jgi:hypothetical protein
VSTAPTPIGPPARAWRNVTTGIYLDESDRLYVRAHNAAASIVLGIRARTLEPDGRYKEHAFTLTLGSTRALDSGSFDLGESFLVGLTVRAESGTVRRGQCYVQLGIGRGGNPPAELSTVMIAGYVTGDGLLPWPGGLARESVEGPGVLRSFTGTNPAPGAEVSETVPTGARWIVRALRVTLVTSAAVATRRVHVIIDDGATVLLDVDAGDTQVASLTQVYHAAAWGYAPPLADTIAVIPLPPDVFMLAGWRIRTLTTLLQGADDYSAPQLTVEEWIET